jgi:hypothetical protein
VVAKQSSVQRYPDNPLEGPSTTLGLMKHMGRFGGNPRLWLGIWVRDHHLERSDRVYRELVVLIDLLCIWGRVRPAEYASVVCFERASRRMQTMLDAYRAPSRAPNWSMSAHYSVGSPRRQRRLQCIFTHVRSKEGKGAC